MNGPDRATTGPRFSGGYQFPRTDAARVSRGAEIRVEHFAGGASARIVELRGGRRRMWDVCGSWTNADGVLIQSSAIAVDELEARSLFVGLCREIARA